MGEVSRKTAEMKTGTYENLTDYKGEPVSAIIGYCKALDVGYSVRMNRDEIYTPVVLFRNTLLVVAVITLCLAVALTYFAIKRFTQPLITLTNHTAEVTKGNLDQRIQLNSNDEIGILGEAFNNMTVKLREDIRNREKSEKMLAHILHGLPIATIVIDKNKKVTHWNSACESLTGIPAEEIVGTDHQWKAFYSTERAILANLMLYKNPKPLLERFYKGNFYKSNKIKDAWMAEDYFPNLGKDGKWLFFTAAPIYDIDGTIIGALEAFQDITKRKRAEEDRQKALEKAIESEKLKTAFLANMSHEIRTPMNGIMGFIDLLNNPDISTYDTQNYTNIIKKNGARLLNTINDIIDISKIESGQMTVVKAETSVNKLLEELYEFFLPETKQKNLKLRCEYALPNNMAIISTDNNKLHAILRNLIKNAIKYTRKGSIIFGYSEKGNFLEFYIHDTGMGIPKERIQAVFNRFEQADIEDKGSFEGSGLGLAISKAYVEMLGGTIHVESKTENREKEIPGWSKFNFTIPYNAISANAIKNHTNNENKTIIPKIKNSRISILIIEDDTSSALLLESMLNDYYSNIISLSGGLEAVTYLKENNPADVVLMDIKMAKMNGYEATKEIRKFNDKITIIAQTAYAMEGDRKKAIEAGCNDYITKPIDKNKLLDIIDQHINNKSTD